MKMESPDIKYGQALSLTHQNKVMAYLVSAGNSVFDDVHKIICKAYCKTYEVALEKDFGSRTKFISSKNIQKEDFQMSNLRLSSPWITHYRKITAMFQGDNEIKVVLAPDYVVNIYVDNAEKADAIGKLIKKKVYFNNICMTVNVIPANKSQHNYSFDGGNKEIAETAFHGNTMVSAIKTNQFTQDDSFTFVVFKNKDAQFYNDNISSLWGIATIPRECIARDIFDPPIGIFFCTEPGEDIASPLI